MFNNSVQDQTYLAEMAGHAAFSRCRRAGGALAPMRVCTVNGRDLGLYVVFEAMNKAVPETAFHQRAAAIFTRPTWQDINVTAWNRTAATTPRQADRPARSCTACQHRRRRRNAGRALNRAVLDTWINSPPLSAMEMLTCHRDGYAIHTNNFRTLPSILPQIASTSSRTGWTGRFYRPNMSPLPTARQKSGRTRRVQHAGRTATVSRARREPCSRMSFKVSGDSRTAMERGDGKNPSRRACRPPR